MIHVTRLDGTGEPVLLSPCDDDEVQLTPAWSGDGSLRIRRH